MKSMSDDKIIKSLVREAERLGKPVILVGTVCANAANVAAIDKALRGHGLAIINLEGWESILATLRRLAGKAHAKKPRRDRAVTPEQMEAIRERLSALFEEMRRGEGGAKKKPPGGET